MLEGKCGGVVTSDTTVEELRERGFSEAAIVEVVAFRDWLALPGPRQNFEHFLATRRRRYEATVAAAPPQSTGEPEEES